MDTEFSTPLTARSLKLEAKKRMGLTAPLWMKATFLFVALQVALTLLSGSMGGTLGFYLLDLTKYPDVVTGFSRLTEGFSLILRLDLLGIVLALPLSSSGIQTFLLVNLLVFLLLAPLRLATVERYCLAQVRGKAVMIPKLLRWYLQPRLTGKAFVVEGLLLLGYRGLGLLALLPGSVCYYLFYSGQYAQSPTALKALAMAALLLSLAGGLVFCFLYSTFLPLRYALALAPEDSLGQILRRGFSMLKGARIQFCKLQLSFVPWYFISQIGYGAPNLYIFPYASMTSLLFLQQHAGTQIQQTEPDTL